MRKLISFLFLVAVAMPALAQQPAAKKPVQRAAATAEAARKGGAPARPATATRVAGTARPNVPPGFDLDERQQAELDAVLRAWEQKTDQIESFKCKFSKWEYDPTFGDPNNAGLKEIGTGEIKYKSPDRGMYRELQRELYLPPNKTEKKGTYAKTTDGLIHWVCDGKAVYEYDHGKKRLVETPLPKEMQGKAISDGPLPFVFGAKADKLKERYFLRVVTPSDVAAKQIWLEARPRWQKDAANFLRVEMILTKADYLPFAMQIHTPGGKQRKAYEFQSIVLNDPLSFLKGDFAAPRTPLGWKRVVEDPNAPPPAAERRPEPGKDSAARRPTADKPLRK